MLYSYFILFFSNFHEDGECAYIEASNRGYLEALEIMLMKKPDITHHTDRVSSHYDTLLFWLIEPKNKNTILCEICDRQGDRVEFVDMLCQYGSDIHHRNLVGCYFIVDLFHFSVKIHLSTWLPVVKITISCVICLITEQILMHQMRSSLVHKNCNILQWMGSPLYYCLRNADIVSMLLGRGASVNTLNAVQS